MPTKRRTTLRVKAIEDLVAANLGTDTTQAAQIAALQTKTSAWSTIAMGRATLVLGTVTVNHPAVTAASNIFVSRQVTAGVAAGVAVTARTPGVSFTITSTSAADTSTIAWLVVEP